MSISGSNNDDTNALLDQDVYTVAELAQRLKVSSTVVYRLLYAGEISGYRVGRKWVLPRQSVQRYLTMNTLLREKERTEGGSD